MITLPLRAHPYVVGEIGFVVMRMERSRVIVQLRDTPNDDGANGDGMVTGMACIEALTEDGAKARILTGQELEDALREFGYPELRLGLFEDIDTLSAR